MKTIKANKKEDYISLAKLRRIVDSLQECNPQTKITFEYMCSFFPGILDNMKSRLQDAYDKGYQDGKNAQ